MPLMTVKTWLIFENTCSRLTGLMPFFHAGHDTLLAIVAVLSLLVPLANMFLVTLMTWTY
jgi:hypothetical protein